VTPFAKRQKNDAADAVSARPRLRREAIESPAAPIPAPVRELARVPLDRITALGERVAALEKELRRRAPADAQMARPMTVPGIGAIGAAAIAAFAPPTEGFRSGRDFAAWIGLTPKQHSTGGKTRLGRTSKMGQRDIRRLLIIGAMAVVQGARRKGAPAGSWLAGMLARKPVMLVAMALANKMARIVWAISTREEDYRDPAAGGGRGRPEEG
jgi:transposase